MARRRKSIDLDDLLTEGGDSTCRAHICAEPGCDLPGEFRAPSSRENLRKYIWFCLDHVRAFNKSWNYYDGMSEAEIESDRHSMTFWNRPTWPFNGRRIGDGMRDEFGFFDAERRGMERRASAAANAGLDPETLDALATMKLSPPVTADAIKRRYKALVKQHHPDANGGDKLAEERLKAINQAYATLMQSVDPERGRAE